MSERKYHFEKLTPIDDVDLTVYGEALDYIFNNSDIKNVAISGAYSAGKSSVLATYKKKHGGLRFVHISLAHFKCSDEEEGGEVRESVLEGKILNQLIHQIPSEKIPQTNFRVKKRISTENVIKRTMEVLALLITTIYFVFFDTWKSYVNTLSNNIFKSILLLSVNQYALIVDGIIIVSIVAFIIYGLINIQKNKNVFRKLNFQGNEIEIFEESDDSYFDKYLNEVLYLFENADADVIVFEDMDRFNVNRIFERLREVNTLVNIHLEKENKKMLRFFYLLRDDIFISKDRTKFFDYIIPIVPIVDGSNAYDQLVLHLKKGRVFEKFDKNFLQGLSLYIDDMRVLKNIYNEFVIYYNKLNTIELDCNKMFAVMTFKNLFPRDFANLQLNQGFVFTIFDSKNMFIMEEKNRLIKQISEKKQEIESEKTNHITSIQQLNVIFAYQYLKGYDWRSYDDERLQKFVLDHLPQSAINEYAKRKQKLESFLSTNISQKKERVHDLEQELSLLQDKPLCEIITRENIDFIFSVTHRDNIGNETKYNDIKSSEYFDLLKYLIRNGYIDETYADYMTYFYENSLGRTDKIFLRSITDKRAKEYTYQLKNPAVVVSRLRTVDFEQEEILNFDLLTYLLSTESYIKYVEQFVMQLKNTKNFKFVREYFDMTTEVSSFVKYLNFWWPEIFFVAIHEQWLTEEQIRRYSICTMYYSDDAVIEVVNKENCLCDYISNVQDYLAIDNPNVERLIHCFHILGVHFKVFDYAKSNKELFYAVYEEALYEINAKNLKLLLREVLKVESEVDVFRKNYSILLANPESAITQYISQNINEYFSVMLKMADGNIQDDEEVAIAVMNDSELTVEHKHSYISALQTIITSIKVVVDTSLWSMLLDANIVQYSEVNIMEYFKAMKIDKSVISYINRCDIELDFSKAEYDDDLKKELFRNIIKCNSIENSKYKQILVSLGFHYNEFRIADISNDKIDILIDVCIIRMTAVDLNFMRENYPNQTPRFIYRNIGAYVDIMTDELFSQNELLEILSWEISDKLKLELLEFSSDEISVIGKDCSADICAYILNNNFMKSDMMSLFSSYEEWDESVQKVILDYAIRNMSNIIGESSAVSEKLKKDLLRSDVVSREMKIDFLIAMLPDINENDIKENLTLLDLREYLKIFDTRSRPKFKINDENKKLLSAFKENNLIYNYIENSEKTGYYKIKRRKPKKPLLKELL